MSELIELLRLATKEKPLTKHEYQLRTGINERFFRKSIQELREQGHRVVSTAEHGGYWLAKSESEYQAFRRQQISRIFAIRKQLRAMDMNLPGQTEMEEV